MEAQLTTLPKVSASPADRVRSAVWSQPHVPALLQWQEIELDVAENVLPPNVVMGSEKQPGTLGVLEWLYRKDSACGR